VRCIYFKGGLKTVVLGDGSELRTKAVVITAGVSYRTLEVPGIAPLTGAGIYYGAVSAEANSLNGQPVYIAGGGNSAGQAAMYLSNFASSVNIVIRSAGLSSSMSSYLIEQIAHTPNITVIPDTVVSEVAGTTRLERIGLTDLATKECTMVDAGALFVFIGAKPNTDWLTAEILRDRKGFVLTGRDLVDEKDFKKYWSMDREPYLLETSVPGVFAAGDIRSGAIARVASAVGEGAMSIRFVHEYLTEI
jgi:thioredoxin reductase (NADPH)